MNTGDVGDYVKQFKRESSKYIYTIPYFFSYKIKKNPRNLDPYYKTDFYCFIFICCTVIKIYK